MSFATDISDSRNIREILVEIDIPIINSLLINDLSGGWFTVFHDEIIEVEDDYGVTAYYPPNCQVLPDKIDSLLVDSDFYLEVDTYALYVETDSSFYYNEDINAFYIHFEDWNPPTGKIVRVGWVNGFSKDKAGSLYFGETEYPSRVLKVPVIVEKKDPLFFGVLGFQSGNFSFANNDGFFDNFHDLNIKNQPIRMKLGIHGYAYDQYEQVYEGYIEDYNYNFNTFNIISREKKKSFSTQIPYNTFTQTEFPYLSDDDVNKFKPIVFGYVRKMPVVCIDSESGGSTYNFKFLDTEYGKAYSGNTGELTAWKQNADTDQLEEITVNSVDLVSGTFNCDAGSETSGVFIDGEVVDVWVDCYGPTVPHFALDAVKFLFEQFGGITYNSTFFNTVEIGLEFTGSYEYEIGFWIDTQTPLIDIVGDVMKSINSIFYTQGDGRFSIKVYDNSRSVTSTIDSNTYFSEPGVGYNNKKFLTSASVTYNKNYRDDKIGRRINTEYEEDRFLEYKELNTKEFSTLISFLELSGPRDDSLNDFLDNIMLSTDNNSIVKRSTNMNNYDSYLMDFVSASHVRINESDDFKTYEITTRSLDPNQWVMGFELREV